MALAYIKFVNAPGDPAAPDNTLPGDPAAPDNSLPGAGAGAGGGGSRPPRPAQLPTPPHRWGKPKPWPPGPTDPSWGAGAPGAPSFPIYQPIGPDNSLPPVDGNKPPVNPPPGTVWPPIPGNPVGKAAILVWIPGVGHRYVVVDLPATPQPVPPPTEPTDPTAPPVDPTAPPV